MKKGFTFVELLIVIAIIGVLASILFITLGQGPLQSARDTKRISDLKELQSALNLYYSTNSSYPDLSGLVAALVPTFISALPLDPRDKQSGAGTCAGYTPNFPSTGYAADELGYRYEAGTNNQGYVLKACLEDKASQALLSDCDDINLDPPCTLDTSALPPVNIYDVHS